MSLRRLYRPLILAGCALTGIAVTVAVGTPTVADGPLLELLIEARSIIVPEPTEPPAAAPVVVVALDRRSLDSDELAEIPRALMVSVWASLLDALEAAGARGVGFDMIFAYSGNRFRPDFDAPFLEALARNRSRIVLARSDEALPGIAFQAALRANETPDALGLATIHPDPDGTTRRVRAVDVRTGLPGLAASLLHRAHGRPFPEEVLLVPRRHLETIPTYAIIDVLRCAKQSPAAVRRAIGGKVVLVGGTLPQEDRKAAAGRRLTPVATDAPPIHPCGLRRLGASAPGAANVPGVFVHAAAIEAVLTNQLTATAPTGATAGITALSGIIGAALGLALPPYLTLAAVLILGGALFAVATAALAADVWAPVALPLAGLVAAPAVAYAVRYLVEERAKRRLQVAFSHYLSPRVVERLLDEGSELSLGGEQRDLTIMFADLSGFTSMSAQLDAEALTRLTNQYLGYIVDHVDATGGYVDKFIGDAVMAMWGAPVHDPDHAVHGVGAALDAATRIREEGRLAVARGERRYFVKIGINSGPAVVGNVGTARRYNYTAVGETVNVASRLEGVPGIYGCQVVLGPATAAQVHEVFLLRELDAIQVRGREAPLTIYQPIARQDGASPEQRDRVARYAEALGHYRARRFADAAVLWEAIAKDEEPAVDVTEEGALPRSPGLVMAARAQNFLSDPPPDTWSGVWIIPGK